MFKKTHPVRFAPGEQQHGWFQLCLDRACIVLLFLLWMPESGSNCIAAQAEQSEQRPNVLFMAIDDLATVLGCYGHPVVQTPNLDRLAAKGVRFDRAYCQIPLCNPSRASVMTGMRPDQIRVYDLDRHFRDELASVITLPQRFRQQGWKTVRVGKIYHYNVPNGIGTAGLDDPISWNSTINPRGRDVQDAALITNPTPERPISAALSWLKADGTDEQQTDGMIASEALSLLATSATPAAEPWFLAVGFFRPHTPFVAPKKYFDLYPPEQIELPQSPTDDRDDIPAAAFAHNCLIPNYGLDQEVCRQALQAYYASVSFVDAQVGRLLDALDTLQLVDNTIVVVWSDHGYHLGEHQGIWQKRTLFEESARSPLIIYAPDRILSRLPAVVRRTGNDDVSIQRVTVGRAASGNGRACRRIVEFVDIYPTIAELCGIVPPETIAGRSLVPLLREPAAVWNGAALTQILRPGDAEPVMGRSIRTDRWRYTEWNEGESGQELYDHWNDPQELKNLAKESSLNAVISGLRKQFQDRAQGRPPQTPFNKARL